MRWKHFAIDIEQGRNKGFKRDRMRKTKVLCHVRREKIDRIIAFHSIDNNLSFDWCETVCLLSHPQLSIGNEKFALMSHHWSYRFFIESLFTIQIVQWHSLTYLIITHSHSPHSHIFNVTSTCQRYVKKKFQQPLKCIFYLKRPSLFKCFPILA